MVLRGIPRTQRTFGSFARARRRHHRSVFRENLICDSRARGAALVVCQAVEQVDQALHGRVELYGCRPDRLLRDITHFPFLFGVQVARP